MTTLPDPEPARSSSVLPRWRCASAPTAASTVGVGSLAGAAPVSGARTGSAFDRRRSSCTQPARWRTPQRPRALATGATQLRSCDQLSGGFTRRPLRVDRRGKLRRKYLGGQCSPATFLSVPLGCVRYQQGQYGQPPRGDQNCCPEQGTERKTHVQFPEQSACQLPPTVMQQKTRGREPGESDPMIVVSQLCPLCVSGAPQGAAQADPMCGIGSQPCWDVSA